MAPHSASAPESQDKNLPSPQTPEPIIPWPHQIEAAGVFHTAIWNGNDPALFVAPVATGKTLILVMAACSALLERGCKNVIVVSRSRHVAQQSLETLHRYAPGVSGGLYSGSKKQTGQVLFATIQTLARHIDVVAGADLLLIDECDQAYLRETTKEYAAVLAACKKYAGVTGTPVVLEKGRTVPIYGRGKVFSEPCGVVTKATLRDLGYFHFIEAAPIEPSRQLKIDRAKIDLSGDYDTKVPSTSEVMLATIAADTKAAMDLLAADQQFLFFGSTTAQCDKQVEAYTAAGLRVAAYHNGMTASAQGEVIKKFRAGELQGLCTVTKVNRGFDLPSISLVVIGFATASRSKFEQMCGRAQRVFPGKTAAWVLDYGGHGQRFGSANWDFYEAIEFDRREKLRVPAEELADAIRARRHDPKCETRPDNFLDLFEATVDLFDIILKRETGGAFKSIMFILSAIPFKRSIPVTAGRRVLFVR